MTRVHIIGTGGTIASRPERQSGTENPAHADVGAVASVSINDIIRTISFAAELEVSAQDILMTGSYSLGMSQMLQIATEVLHRLNDPTIDAVVVTHGTDTMEETAFLAELVNDSKKTVVFTGAQRSAEHADTDGPRNLGQALIVAADSRFKNMGALVCFDGEVQSARGIRKAHTTASQPFHGGATVGAFRGEALDIVASPARQDSLPLPTNKFGSIRVDILVTYPGSDPDTLMQAARSGANCIILAGTGVGNAGPGYAKAIAEAVAAGLPIVLSSRAPAGPVVPLYANGGGVDLIAAGAISAGNLSPFQARILAACLLAQEISMTEFNKLFSINR